MSPLVAESHERSKRFHADIARRAALVPRREVYSYSVPNTPFGVPKELPAPASPEPPRYYAMWFYELVRFAEKYVSGPTKSMRINVRDIQHAVAEHYGVTVTDIVSSRRTADVVLPRQVAVYLCRKLTTRSLPEIGRYFGGRDHTTQIHSYRKIEAMAEVDANLRSELEMLAAAVGGRLA